MDYGIKVTASGYSVDTSDITKITMSSSYPMFKYHADLTGSITLLDAQTDGEVSFAHSLGYVPMAVGYVTFTGDGGKQRALPFGRIPQPIAISIFSHPLAVNCKIVKATGGGDITFNFRVIIFKDKLL